MTAIPLTVNALCPSHGPVVQASLTELLRSYQYVPAPQAWEPSSATPTPWPICDGPVPECHPQLDWSHMKSSTVDASLPFL